MIQLGATVLNHNLVWSDRDSSQKVLQQRARTLGGTQVVWSQGVSGGRNITLVANIDQGWFTKEQKDAVAVMADTTGGTFALTIGAESFTVIFRHDEAPATDFTPFIPRAVDLTGDYFTGQIKLVTV